MYVQSMAETAPHTAPEVDDIDPALVEAMKARVVRRKPQDYGNRKAGPGRPKGSSKVPGSGKKAGTPNLMSPEFRQWLMARAKPFELLAAICAGEEIEDKDGKRKPTMSERLRAAETISRKLLPDLRATELTGKDGEALIPDDAPVTDFELARKAAFLLAKVNHELVEREEAERAAHRQPSPATPLCAPEPTSVPVAASAPLEPQPEPEAARQPGETHQVGELSITFAEALPGDREHWAIRDQNGRLVGTAFGREAAERKAKTIGEE